MPDFISVCDSVCKIARNTGKYILTQAKEFDQNVVEEKGEHNYVSFVDKTAEQKIVDALSGLIPDAGFITEEGTASNQGNEFNWIIDPLDGTTNFIHKVPVYCISIALMQHKEVVIGVVYEINRDECFYASKDSEAMLNGNSIRVSTNRDFNSSLLATGFPYYDYGKLDEYLDVFKYFAKHTAGLRRLGSAAADLAYVACGRFEGFYEYGLHPWDVAAGGFIVQMAGGVTTDFSGGDNYIFGKELIAGNPSAHVEMQSVISKLFGK